MNSFKRIPKLIIAVLAILVLTAGLASAVVPATRTITAGTGSGTAGQSAEVLIPISIDYPDAVGVGGIACTIIYDPAALTYLGLAQATPGQTINDGSAYLTGSQYANPYTFTPPAPTTTLFFMDNPMSGQVIVAGASAEPLTGTTLFNARFLIKSAAVGGQTYPIRLVRSSATNAEAGYSSAGELLPVLVGTGDKVGGVYTSTTFPVIPTTLVAGGITVSGTSYSIGGKVTYGTGTGAPGAGCTVILTEETGTGYVFIGQALVGTTGLYSFSGKYPGNYKISVQSLDPNYDNYDSSVIALTTASITTADAVLPTKTVPTRISGTVTGTIPAGLVVKVVDASDNVKGIYSVGTGGAWSSSLLPGGQTYHWYLVYGSLSSAKDATTFDTSVLKTISGTVSGMTSNSGVLTATSATGKLQKSISVTNVGYTITDLVPANDYIVSVVSSGLPVTYYNGQTDVNQATPVNISTTNATGISFTFVPPTGHITGWIKNSGTGVIGTTVYGFDVNTFALVQATTGTGGVYDLSVTPGTYEVFVIKSNGKIFYFYDTTGVPTQYESNAVTRTVTGTTPVANTNIDIAECDKTLTGKVTARLATGDPVANALITAFTETNRSLGLTGQDGRYAVGGLCDVTAYTVEMKPLTGNYPVQFDTVTISGSNTTKNFIVDTGVKLSGTVLEEGTSTPVNGAMIFLRDKVTGALVGGRVYFSASGAYNIQDVGIGDYTMEVTHPDYHSYTVDFLIGSDEILSGNITRNVVLAKGAYFKGTVTDPVNNLDGATIIVTQTGTTPVYTMTNKGLYGVYGLDAAVESVVIAQKKGYERQVKTMDLDGTTPLKPTTSGKVVDFALAAPTATYTVSGTVKTDATTSPEISGAIVLVSSLSKNFFASATTAGNGTYSIPGLTNAADYQIVVIPSGNLPIQSDSLAVSGGNVSKNFTIALGATIGGTVSGPASGSLVSVFLYKGSDYVGFVDTTNGAFTFKGLTAGTDYKVLAVASGYVSHWSTGISSGTTNISITLAP